MTLREKSYKPRIIDESIRKRLDLFGAVCIEGPKWCGKTWTGLNHAESVIFVGDPQKNFQNRTLIELDNTYALEGARPRLIDEWQEIPSLWDAVRHQVDRDGQKGQYILTGSSTPKRKGVLHSGAGRIDKVRMRSMSLYESGESNGKVSIREIFEGFQGLKQGLGASLEDLIYLTIRGGWPGNIETAKDKAGIIPHSYLKTLIEDDYESLPENIQSSRKLMSLIKSLSRNTGTLASNNTLAKDMREFEDESVTASTVSKYLDVLERIFIIENLNAFDPNYRSSSRVAKNPKRFFTDPSIAIASLDLTAEKLKGDLKLFGFLFESMVIRDLKIYTEANDGKIFHYRHFDRRDEIDAVIEMPSGKWGAFEIKLGTNQIDEAAEKLLAMKEGMKSDKAVSRAPDILCVISGLADVGYKRKDGVYVVPITALKD